MRPSVEIACDVFEGEETKKTLEYPDPNDGFRILLTRIPSGYPQYIGVELFCTAGYLLGLAKSPDEILSLFENADLHCEGCNSDIKSTIRRAKGKRKPTA